MKKVFISHSSKDKAAGDEICQYLEANGVSCWIAPRDVMPGKNYGAAIVDAIDECAVFLLVLTNESNKSGQVVREVERAASSNSIIIPLRIDPVQPSRNLEFYVSSSHWLDATDKPLAKHLGNLLDAIRNWESREEPPPEKAVPTRPPAPSTSARDSKRPLIIASAIGGVALCAILIDLAFRPSPSSKSKTSPEVAAGSTSTAEATAGPNPVVASPTPLPTSPTPTIAAAPQSPAATPPVAPPIIQKISASSVLAPELHRGEMRHYDETLAFDNDNTTAWVPTTSGLNQWIKASFKSPVTITSVSIYGGYGVDAQRYEANNRARTVRVTFSDGTAETFDLEDKMKLQHLDLPRPVVTDSARIEILAVYRGERHDETPISEIAFNRDAN